MYSSKNQNRAQSLSKGNQVPSTLISHPSPLNRNEVPSPLFLTVISAPSAEVREEVAKHLRYWPYVKFFKYQGHRHLLCCICLGEAKDGYTLKQLYERSRQLVLLCLRQYDVTITRWKPLPTDFRLFHNNRLFTRPDESLRPFITFMGEEGLVSSFKMQVSSNGTHLKPETTARSMKLETMIIPGRHYVPQNLSKIYHKISQYILNNFRVNF